MQPRQIFETVRPVRPSFTYFTSRTSWSSSGARHVRVGTGPLPDPICPAAGDEGLRCPPATSSQQAGHPDREGARAVHIPDGYLSPQTCAVMYGAAVPFWVVAARRIKKVVKNRYVPLLAVGAAYCFLVMMFNVPIPDRTTAHAVGAVLIAVLLGPWAAVIAVSIALIIQALFFGDGGVLAYGANVVNMAFVMPMVGYGLYVLLSRGSSITSGRRAISAGVAAYVGLNAAALCAAIEFGLQPTLF